MAGQGHSLPANGELPRPLTPSFYSATVAGAAGATPLATGGGEKRPALLLHRSERVWSRKVSS
jgi:hypothetical protein